MKKTDLFRSRGVAVAMERHRGAGHIGRVDALELLAGMRDSVCQIVFLDPPFNLGKEYGRRSRFEGVDEDEYIRAMREIVEESARVVKPGGSVFLYNLPRLAVRLAPALGDSLEFRHWIAIAMNSGFARGHYLYPSHYALLYYTKGSPTSFSRPRIAPQRCRHCGDYVKDYGGYRSIIDDKGVNLSDVWTDLSPVRHARLKHRGANELPQALTDRIVEMAGNPGSTLVDPFAGSGTSLVSAARAGMWFVGSELAAASLRTLRKRLELSLDMDRCGCRESA